MLLLPKNAETTKERKSYKKVSFKITQGHTIFRTDLGFGMVVLRHVSAMVCAQCGEEWLDDATAEKFEQTIERARENRTVVEVIEWRDGGGLFSIHISQMI